MKNSDSKTASHQQTAPLAWVERWLSVLPTGASVLDFAAGAGRHARFAADAGMRVTAADRDVSGLQDLAGRVAVVQADLEADAWPFEAGSFDAVITTNFLHRPRLAELIQLVAPGGWLIYQTFGVGNARYGRPRNPDFLLTPAELFSAATDGGLIVAGYENGLAGADGEPSGQAAVVQRVAAWRPPPGTNSGGSAGADLAENDPAVPPLP
jgi:SAM-dependent methyltransferase